MEILVYKYFSSFLLIQVEQKKQKQKRSGNGENDPQLLKFS